MELTKDNVGVSFLEQSLSSLIVEHRFKQSERTHANARVRFIHLPGNFSFFSRLL